MYLLRLSLFSFGGYFFNSLGISEGSCATRIPAASKDSIFSFAEPELPEIIAPAWPICFPGGADCPAPIFKQNTIRALWNDAKSQYHTLP